MFGNLYFLLLKLLVIRTTVCAVIATAFIISNPLYAQNIDFTLNDYKTALLPGEIGDWEDPTTWEVWDGTVWSPASAPPDRENNVFIEKDKEVTLNQDQEVGNLYIYGQDIQDDQPGKKLNLQTFNLDVYGVLVSFGGLDGDFYLHPSTSGITDWIYPETGNIVFRGNSRTIVDRASWSANNGNSRFGVIFNPGPDEILTVNSTFKANSFVVQSGTVVQTVNTEGAEATSTFSFNTQEAFGSGAYGVFVIEPGATLISDGTGDFGDIIRRTDSKPAAEFHLMEGGTLVLNGENPVMEAANILLEGDVYYSGETGNQLFINGSSGMTPTHYNNLFFEGEARKNLPGFLALHGDFTFIGGGDILGDLTILTFQGEGDQEVINISLILGSAEVVKSSGTLYFDGNLTIIEHFTMSEGEVDFLDNQLELNLFRNGSYTYYGGSWKNLGQLTYFSLPPEFTTFNTTFPFEDQFLGGLRRVHLSGSNPSPNADLTITYTQLPGVNWNPDFNDHDGTPILYKLNSYFTINVTGSDGTAPVSLHISADNLIVEDADDLRIVSNEAAAPGTHLPGEMEEGEFLASRSLTFNDLNNQTFTIGSTGIASVLPVTWLSYTAEELLTGNLISWSTSKEVENEKFVILKSMNDGEDFEEIGEVEGSGTSNEIHHYSFLDKTVNLVETIYYQIKQVDLGGNIDFSPVFSLRMKDNNLVNQFKIFPNPFGEGELNLVIPQEKRDFPSTIEVYNIFGKRLIQENGSLAPTSQSIIKNLRELNSGVYLIRIEITGELRVLKWIKE